MTPEEIEKANKQQEVHHNADEGYTMTMEEYETLQYESESVKRLKETSVRFNSHKYSAISLHFSNFYHQYWVIHNNFV